MHLSRVDTAADRAIILGSQESRHAAYHHTTSRHHHTRALGHTLRCRDDGAGVSHGDDVVVTQPRVPRQHQHRHQQPSGTDPGPPEIYRAVIRTSTLTRARRRELSRWLSDNCGRPCRDTGFWWSEDGPNAGDITISFVLPEKFTEFWMRWC